MSLNDTLKKLLLTAAQEALWSFGTECSARCEHCGWRSTWTPEELMKFNSGTAVGCPNCGRLVWLWKKKEKEDEQ